MDLSNCRNFDKQRPNSSSQDPRQGEIGMSCSRMAWKMIKSHLTHRIVAASFASAIRESSITIWPKICRLRSSNDGQHHQQAYSGQRWPKKKEIGLTQLVRKASRGLTLFKFAGLPEFHGLLGYFFQLFYEGTIPHIYKRRLNH